MKKMKKDNRGMALVSVIVVIGFIAALVSIILVTTVVNFKMKAVNERGKDTFYSAEQALDEVNIGLQRIVSDSMSEAYIEIMESYSDYAVMENMSEEEQKTINQKRTNLLKTRFYENVWTALRVGDDHTKYDVNILDGMLKEHTKWNGTDEDGYGAILVAVAEDGTESKSGDMITYSDSGIVLKNFKVYYKDPAGFVSVIKTDIRLAYPDFSFDRTSELPDIIYYSLVADEQAVIEESASKISLKGKIYANDLYVDGREIETAAADDITVKYDIEMKDSNFKSGDDNIIWAQNLILDSSTATIKGNVSVANDLNLKGIEPKFTFEGDYTGFGNDNSEALRSSSVLLNGKNSTIDVSKALRFVLAGHTFAGTSKSKTLKNENLTGTYSTNARMSLPSDKNTDIFMSESIAPKYDQLMYLVPAAAVGVNKDTKESRYNKNPLTFAEYSTIVNDEQYIEVSSNVEINELAGETLENFTVGESGDGVSAKVKRVFVRVSDPNVEGLVYYYMDFDGNETMAQNYFSLYYNNNKNSADKYMDFYINEILMPPSSSDVKIAGDYFIGKKNDEDGFADVPANTLSGATEIDNLCKDKWSLFMERVKVENAADICYSFEDDDETHQKYYEAIIAQNTPEEEVTLNGEGIRVYPKMKLEDFISKVSRTGADVLPDKEGNPSEYQIVTSANKVKIVNRADNSKVYAVICSDPTSTVGGGDMSAETCLIITKGNAQINQENFHGLVISDKTVTFTDSVKEINADPAEVGKILRISIGYPAEGIDGEGEVDVSSMLEDSKLIGSKGSDGDSTKQTPGGMITYENWTKE